MPSEVLHHRERLTFRIAGHVRVQITCCSAIARSGLTHQLTLYMQAVNGENMELSASQHHRQFQQMMAHLLCGNVTLTHGFYEQPLHGRGGGMLGCRIGSAEGNI